MKTTNELSVITFPHPVLRYPAKPVLRVDDRLREIVHKMFALMYEHRGVGLAATQIGLPVRIFVMNASGKQDEGVELAMINPIISRPRGNESAEEGCLSLPNIHGNVIRSKTIRVNAYTPDGLEINQDFSGFDARIIQHEVDHLDGKLFIDRLKEGAEAEIQGELEQLRIAFESSQRTGSIADQATLLTELNQWEAAYC